MEFPDLRTERLMLRRPRLADVESFHARRNDPEVQRYETWTLPFPRERIQQHLEKSIEMGGPASDQGWLATIANLDDTAIFGDLFIEMSWGGRSAEVGFTLDRAQWGRGYAVEATAELVRWLFEDGDVTRVSGQLHPDNVASAQVLERTGFCFEGHTRKSFWVGEENSDDWFYGMDREDWTRWINRETTPPSTVSLIEIDATNQSAVRKLAVHRSQERLVSPVVASMADALFPEVIDGAPVVPWMRAVQADHELAGFVMLALVTDDHPEPYLWRLLVDRFHQRRGIGERILELVVDELRSTGSTTLLTSFVEGRGGPRPFYEGLGFVPTGRIIDGEVEARLTLPD